MERFEELKNEILRRAHEAHACTEQYGRAYKAETLDGLMQVVRDNFHWCCNSKVLDGALIDAYREEFNAGKIWHNEESITEGFMLMDGSSQGEFYGSSQGEFYGSSQGEFYDSSQGVFHGSSQGVFYGSSYAISYDIKECKLHDHALYRIINLNEVRYADSEMKFVKVEEGK